MPAVVPPIETAGVSSIVRLEVKKTVTVSPTFASAVLGLLEDKRTSVSVGGSGSAYTKEMLPKKSAVKSALCKIIREDLPKNPARIGDFIDISQPSTESC